MSTRAARRARPNGPAGLGLTTLGAFAVALALLGPAPAEAQSAIVDWQPCALSDADTERRADCALVQMPLDHGDPAAGSIGIAIKRLRSTRGADAPTRIWFFDGGPGDSGIHSLPRLDEVLGHTGVDLYTLDHRGVGRSAELSCPDQEAETSPGGMEILEEEWAGCIEHLREARPDLPYLTTTQAAEDAAAMIEATASDGVTVVAFGASYGTYWVQRYLEAYPDQPDAVILDGMVPPGWSFAEFDAAIDATARDVMASCSAVEACAGHLGADPVAIAAALPGRFDEGHCPDLQIDGATVRLLLGNMLMAGQDIWPFIPPMVHRLNQCRLRDLLAIGELFTRLFEERGAGQEDPSHSPVLQRHVALSELWPDPAPEPARLREALGSTLMTTSVSANFAATWADWPRYPRPEPLAPPSFEGPALLLHGSLDPTMRPQRLGPLVEAFDRPGQRFLLLPGIGHVTLGKSPCAGSIYEQFLRDPGAELDASCVASLQERPLRMPDAAPLLFGTDDLWGDRLSDLEWLLYGALAGILLLIVGAVWLWRRRRQRRRSAGRAED